MSTAAEEAAPPDSKVRTPLYEAKVDPDINFFGFISVDIEAETSGVMLRYLAEAGTRVEVGVGTVPPAVDAVVDQLHQPSLVPRVPEVGVECVGRAGRQAQGGGVEGSVECAVGVEAREIRDCSPGDACEHAADEDSPIRLKRQGIDAIIGSRIERGIN